MFLKLLLEKFIAIIVEKIRKVFAMARPRILKLGEKELVLKNFTKEEADKLQETLSGVPNNTEVVVEDSDLTEPLSELTHEAIGVFPHKGTKRWSYVVVKYNPETKEAKVETIQEHENRALAVSEFKLEGYKKNFV